VKKKKITYMGKEGDRVTWESQAQGWWNKKTGVIVQVVPAGELPDRDRFLSLYKGAGIGMARNHESYVVQLNQEKPHRVPKFYWPRVSALQAMGKKYE